MDVYPECRCKRPTKIIRHANMNWVPLYCANCGADGGIVPEDNCDFAFYLCVPCSEKLGPIEGIYQEPDHLFWEAVAEEQIAKYGHMLQPGEIVEAMKDDTSTLAKLGKDRPDYSKIRMT